MNERDRKKTYRHLPAGYQFSPRPTELGVLPRRRCCTTSCCCGRFDRQSTLLYRNTGAGGAVRPGRRTVLESAHQSVPSPPGGYHRLYRRHRPVDGAGVRGSTAAAVTSSPTSLCRFIGNMASDVVGGFGDTVLPDVVLPRLPLHPAGLCPAGTVHPTARASSPSSAWAAGPCCSCWSCVCCSAVSAAVWPAGAPITMPIPTTSPPIPV